MNYKDLPPRLQELVKKYTIEQKGEEIFNQDVNNTTIMGLFTWSATPEGSDFWYNINKGDIPEEYKNQIIENFPIY